MEKFLEEDATKLLDITAKCYFGFPFVVGQCKTLEEAGRVVEIAREVTGNPVVPYILKKGDDDEKCNIAMNLKITTELNARLAADKKIFSTNIFVKTVQCHVVLLGVVGSKEAVKAAMVRAKNVGGVKEIRSYLVSTDTNRSWDSVFKTISEMAGESEKQPFEPSQKPAPELPAKKESL